MHEVQWKSVPGFQEFAKLVITAAYMEDPQVYSDSFKKVMIEVMANPMMLSPLIQIVYKKTSAYNYFAVQRTMEMTADWLIRIETLQCQIPNTFPFEFFNKALNILIDLDHSCSTAKAIWLLFQTVHILPVIEGDKLLMKLLEPKQFYSLFFNWSWHVRMCFIYFYFFQANRLLADTSALKETVL